METFEIAFYQELSDVRRKVQKSPRSQLRAFRACIAALKSALILEREWDDEGYRDPFEFLDMGWRGDSPGAGECSFPVELALQDRGVV